MAGILCDILIGFRHNRARASRSQCAAVGGIDAQNGGLRATFVIIRIFADGDKGGTQYHDRFDGNAPSFLQFHYPPFAVRSAGCLIIAQEQGVIFLRKVLLEQPACRAVLYLYINRRLIVVKDTVNILFVRIQYIIFGQIAARTEDDDAFVCQSGNGGRGGNRPLAFENSAYRPFTRIGIAQIKAVHIPAPVAGIGDIDCAVQIFIHQRGGRKPAFAVLHFDFCNQRT
ncbi:Uncharacterised protein [Neisseria gonorrhoeae]|nr:Uncharacterised protein [Neisseria gonorrhoeae]CNT28289.1 Uncharacterised protein [Neisseria gonorrhoeae]